MGRRDRQKKPSFEPDSLSLFADEISEADVKDELNSRNKEQSTK
jgi:hypothetical protein